jgi:hypothetical protein
MTDATVREAHDDGHCTPGQPELSFVLGCMGTQPAGASQSQNGHPWVVPISRSQPESQPDSSVRSPRRLSGRVRDRVGGHACVD